MRNADHKKDSAFPTQHSEQVLAIDPGRDKCGLAVVAVNGDVVMRRIVPSHEVQSALQVLLEQHHITQIVLGDSTTSHALHKKLSAWLPGVPIATVDETGSTLEARTLYWQAHPSHGWRRLTPLSLQVPPEPIDDFAAVVLARRYFAVDGRQ